MTRIVLGGCLVTVLTLAPAAISGQATPPQQGTAKTAPLLYDRVKAAGSHLDEALDAGDVPVANLAELGSRASVVVVGRILGTRSRLAADQQHVTTEVAVHVQESLKGPVVLGSVIYCRVPGGAHRFADGRTARQTAPGFRMPRPRATYVLFLQPIRPGVSGIVGRGAQAPRGPERADYELATGLQGQFELQFERGTVVPAPGGKDHPLAVRYADMPVTDFLAELHRTVGRRR